jgi:hypothetical protein
MIDQYFNLPQIPRRKKRKTNPGFSVTPGMEIPVPIKIDKWEHVKNYTVRTKKRNKANKGFFSLVEFSTPASESITIDKWFNQFPHPRRKKFNNRLSVVDINFIEAIQEINGDYFDTGVVALDVFRTDDEAQTYLDNETIDAFIERTDVEDFQLEDDEAVTAIIEWPKTGVVVFNSGVAGFISVSVEINGVNETANISGPISITREDNTAARFNALLELDQSLVPPKKPVELLNKIISINFSAADMTGVISDYIPIFVGIIKHVSFNEDVQTIQISGYDYGGVHQTKGEFISQNITEVLTGQIYVNSVGTFSTGHSPIWGVTFQGNSTVEDGVDYFVDTKDGTITVPISSRILQFPNSFTYSYSNPFVSMKAIIQAIVGTKNWILQEDNVTIVDYSSIKEHPVLSFSDESIIDISRKFLELSGAKVESNLFPKLRVYSEVQNFITPVNTITVDESKIFENSMTVNIDFDDLLNEQTCRTVQKVNASINIGALEILAKYEGSQGSLNPFTFDAQAVGGGVDYATQRPLVEKRINRKNINSLSFESSGRFYLNAGVNPFSEQITANSWNYFVDGDDFVIQLKHAPVAVGGLLSTGAIVGSSTTTIAFPAIDYSLTVKGTRINYGGGSIEDVKVVTAQRPITGIVATLAGDVYESAYAETEAHLVNICNAILLESGNPYTISFEIPLFEGKEANIGDKIEIKRNSNIIFVGIIKLLQYSIDTNTGINTLFITCKGIGRGI